jgi:hypothetical protein
MSFPRSVVILTVLAVATGCKSDASPLSCTEGTCSDASAADTGGTATDGGALDAASTADAGTDANAVLDAGRDASGDAGRDATADAAPQSPTAPLVPCANQVCPYAGGTCVNGSSGGLPECCEADARKCVNEGGSTCVRTTTACP